ncbi:hypothetical protein PDE_06033 [Penicillium oxalicum 114-2]|uniref:Uncharacterized protein n=1 Tax=Penicillium oxalicum (strain 114-2 / CGMCC 5302) TaxID=933388 RepID=S7ZL77_PENO1|nr:hypothetical protein PDE_06033 [Penicillium oxalicum 114-2]
MLFTKSLEKRRNGTSGTAIEEAGKRWQNGSAGTAVWQGHKKKIYF